jgi:hypothetical protein
MRQSLPLSVRSADFIATLDRIVEKPDPGGVVAINSVNEQRFGFQLFPYIASGSWWG